MRCAPRIFSGGSAIRRIARAAAAFASIACLGAAVAALGFLGALHSAASETPANPEDPKARDEDGFPRVDWNYWQATNPDVVAWITIPGTRVDYPVVQAPQHDPQYYLTHDVYGKPNYMGCPYLDADCTEQGIGETPNAMVFGHNLGYGDDSMFASVASFTDPEFMRSHPEILLQTPQAKMRFRAAGALCMPGDTATKRTDFQNRRDLLSWLNERLGECQSTADVPTDRARQVLTLCTCSYNRWSDERTLLFAIR